MAAVTRAAPPDPLPAGLARLPGPTLLVAARYEKSPVGPYVELAVGVPARLGSWPGFCITTMAVDSDESVMAGQSNWGFPKQLWPLRWTREPGCSWLRADDDGVQVGARQRGPSLPIVAPLCCVQRRADGPVLVLGWLRGRLRSAEVDVEVSSGHPLQALAGRHRGVVVDSLRLVVAPARRVEAQ